MSENKSKSPVINFSKYAMTDQNGALDDAGTMAKFEAEYKAWKEGNAVNLDGIATAVAAVFAEAPVDGARLTIQIGALVTRTLGKLGDTVPLSATQRVTDNIKTFVRNSPLYVIDRGKHGGVMRAEDKARLEAEKAAKEAAKLAAKQAQ